MRAGIDTVSQWRQTHPFCQICLGECNLLRKDLTERYSIYLIGSSHYLLILLTVSIKLSAAVRLADPTISFSVNSGGSLLIFPPISCKYQSRIISYHISPSFWSMHHKLSEYLFSILTSTCKINLKTMLVLAYSLLSLKVFFCRLHAPKIVIIIGQEHTHIIFQDRCTLTRIVCV